MTHSNHTSIHKAFAELTQVDLHLSQVYAQLAAMIGRVEMLEANVAALQQAADGGAKERDG